MYRYQLKYIHDEKPPYLGVKNAGAIAAFMDNLRSADRYRSDRLVPTCTPRRTTCLSWAASCGLG